MKKSRFTESQIFTILKEVDAGMKVEAVCRKHGISNATYYNWKAKYGGMDTSELKRMRELEEENAKLKKMFADVSLQNQAMKELLLLPPGLVLGNIKRSITHPDTLGYYGGIFGAMCLLFLPPMISMRWRRMMKFKKMWIIRIIIEPVTGGHLLDYHNVKWLNGNTNKHFLVNVNDKNGKKGGARPNLQLLTNELWMQLSSGLKELQKQ